MQRAKNFKKRKPLPPPVFTEDEIKGMLAEIGKKHRALNHRMFEKESFRAKIEGETIVLTSHSARSVIYNAHNLKNVKVVFDRTDDNEIKHNYPDYYEKVTDIHKAIMTDVAALWHTW